MNALLKEKLLEQLEGLPPELQRRVLDFATALAQSTPSGVRGEELLRFAGSIPSDDLHTMAEAIESECENEE